MSNKAINLQKIKYLCKEKLQNSVVGRNKEIETIKMQLDRVMEGHSAVTVIAGDIGIGKTVLIKTIMSDLSKLNCACVYGKFEQYKDKEPYIPIIQIIEQIIVHILTLPEEKLNRIKSNLNKELGRDGALITSIVPQALRIINCSKKIKDGDFQKLKRRLEKSFQTFITVAAKELYPLIIVVDDIQWADMPSWDIIKAIFEPLNDCELYLILAYRNNSKSYRARVDSLLQTCMTKKIC